MKAALTGLILIHGFIHFIGFVKAFKPAAIRQLNRPVTPSEGLLWLLAGITFLGTAVVLVLRFKWWWMPGLIALILSQVLILLNWHDAKAGTVANILLLIAIPAIQVN